MSRKDKRADFNAPAIQRMIDAGAIVLGEADLYKFKFYYLNFDFFLYFYGLV